LEEKLEVGSTLLSSLLRDELWICGYAVENFFGVGTHHARPFYCPNYGKLKKSPQNEWMKHYLEYDLDFEPYSKNQGDTNREVTFRPIV
jgi:hypothetical protein